MSCTLREILSAVDAQPAATHAESASAAQLDEVVIDRVTIDSRLAAPGALFVACRGATASSRDGHDFIGAALERGASALVVEDASRLPLPLAAPAFVVRDARRAAALLAERCAGDPSQHLALVGITGTNGKTTTTFLVARIIEALGQRAAVLGTLGVGPVTTLRPLGFTTPEAEVLSENLRILAAEGTRVVAMETSSHALATARVDGVRFAVGAFTNLSRDHLDFHGSMDAYLDAKARLFRDLLPASAPAVLPADDDEHGAGRILRALRPDAITWGQAPGARLRAEGVKKSARGFEGTLVLDGLRAPFTSPLLGSYNLENLLVAVGCVVALGFPLAAVARAVADAGAPPGRLERVPGPVGAPAVVVDYAHTPDALERALYALRDLTPGKLYVVFGCGGDRDVGKRPLMGAVAAEVADAAVVTDDNPRSEDGDAIADAVLAGVGTRLRRVPARAFAAGTCARVQSRRHAIRVALAAAHEDDTVLVAGKGHETTQTIRSRVLPFDDRREVARALRGASAPAFLDRAFVEVALGGRAVAMSGAARAVFAGVSTDSRNVEPGSLFIALVGEHFDAHMFIAQALAGGAAAAVVMRGRPLPGVPADAPLFIVDDTLAALQDLAAAWLRTLPGKRVAITGSNGKTTTKQLVQAGLAGVFGAPAVLATEGNLNNHIGVPLTALGAEADHEALVIEMGMNHLGEIDLLARIAAPHVGLITNMGTAHAGNVGGVEGVAAAKSELWQRMLATGGVAVVNADDPRCVREAEARRGGLSLVSFGRAPWADIRLTGARDLDEGGQLLQVHHGARAFGLRIPLEGRHNAQNACGALAVGLALGVDLQACAAGISSVAPAHGRLERRRAHNGALVLDDTYNANPDSMEAALATLAELAQGRRTVVVLGEMRELGALAEQSHRHIGAAAVQAGAAMLYACGELGRLYLEAAAAAGLPGSAMQWAPDSGALAPIVARAVAPEDVVLIKGSRGARMERVVDALTGGAAAPVASQEEH